MVKVFLQNLHYCWMVPKSIPINSNCDTLLAFHLIVISVSEAATFFKCGSFFSNLFGDALINCSRSDLGTLQLNAMLVLNEMDFIRSTPEFFGSVNLEKTSRLSRSELMNGDTVMDNMSD